MKDLILVGIQGSGKGTQGKILREKFGYQIFETGGELRRMAQDESELGQKVKSIIERGDLVPNEIIMEIVEHFLSELTGDTPVIFDGIPRSEPQRQSLEALIEKHGRKFNVLEIKLSDEESLKRLLDRAEKEGRADDTPEVIAKRIQNFYTHTEPLLNIWREAGRVIAVDGDQAVEGVTESILSRLEGND